MSHADEVRFGKIEDDYLAPREPHYSYAHEEHDNLKDEINGFSDDANRLAAREFMDDDDLMRLSVDAESLAESINLYLGRYGGQLREEIELNGGI